MKATLVLLAIVLLGTYSTVLAQLKPEDESGSVKRRFENFKNRRTPPGIQLPEDIRAKAIESARVLQSKKYLESTQANQPQWQSIGPHSTGGRIKSIIVHPTEQGTLYIGAAAGGVWKTTDFGKTWLAIMDDANGIAMGSLCFDPVDPNIIYAGTGEQVQNANTYLGSGLMRTTDAGATWNVVGLTDVGSFSRIYAHPKNRDLLMASCMNTNGGVYKSLDRGKTWQRMLQGQVYDMTINPFDENEWFVALPDSGIYYTNDGGVTWANKIAGIAGQIERTSIQQSASDPDILYALVEFNDLATIFGSTDRGQTWKSQFNGDGCFFAGDCQATSSQGFYDNYICIDPKNPQVAFAAGIDIWRTTNGGRSWSNVTSGYADGNGANLVHVDQHCLAFDPFDSKRIYAGNDGGMHISSNLGVSWELINNGLAVTQFYSFDTDPTRRERTFGGTQDNGTLGAIEGIEWDTIWGGDGMVTIVNYNNPDIIIGNNPNGTIFQRNLVTGLARYIMLGIDRAEGAEWVAPLVQSPLDPSLFLHGRRRVWRTNSAGEDWFEVSPAFSNNITTISFSHSDPAVVWAATTQGEIIVSEDEGFEWKNIDRTQLANRYITEIQPSFVNRATAWLTYGAYGTNNVWKTTDLGASWKAIWQGMPDVPANCIEVHPDDDNILYVGTDIGVFATYDGGENWQPYGKGLPRSPVLDLKVDKNFGFIRAATHGRSAWEAPLTNVSPSEPVITTPNGGDVFQATVSTVISWSGFTPPVKIEFSSNNGATYRTLATDVVGNAFRWSVPNEPTVEGKIRITSLTATPEKSEIVESKSFTIVSINKGSVVQQRAVPWSVYGLAWDGNNSLWSTSFYERKLYKINGSTFEIEKVVQLDKAVGDSMFTDITMDRATGTLYMHRILPGGVGGYVVTLDTNGKVLRTFPTKATSYPTGLELVNGNLIQVERDGDQRIFEVNATTGEAIQQKRNPFRYYYGPRCLATDDNGTIFQTCTPFPQGGNGALTECFVISINSSQLDTEVNRMSLFSRAGVINARAIEFDRADSSFWIGDFGGNIYKVKGLNYTPPLTSITDAKHKPLSTLKAAPSPASTSTLLTISAVQETRQLTLLAYDIMGNLVATIYTGVQLENQDESIRWITSNIPSGTYNIIATSNGSVVAQTQAIIYR